MNHSKKYVLIISSSPRIGGNSDTLCNQFYAGAVDAGHTAEKINIAKKNINFCRACEICNKNMHTGCSISDDMPEILEKMIAADVIVFATPIYFYTMCAQMKMFIDRCCSIYTQLNNKTFYTIIVGSDNNPENLERTHLEFEGFYSCLNNANERGVILGSGLEKMEDVNGSIYSLEAYAMGKSIE